MKREMKVLEAKIKELRRVMELFDLFQQDDEVGLALREVEEEITKRTFVQVVDTVGLSKETFNKIEDQMEYLGTEVVDDTTFCVLANSKQEVIKIFDFRLKFL